ncbi:MAG: dienelactone hydrolase family protein [Dehalococcoidia bacterium]
MCYELNSSPPIQPIAGAAVSNEDLELVASDGTHFAAFGAIAGDPKGPAVVVLPDVRGLFSFYEELALRFAEIGYDSVAIDYFGRTAGVSKRNDPDFEFRDHVAQTTPEGIAADTRAAVEQLRSRDGQSDRKVFTVGFCFGGGNSWMQAAEGHGLSGVIGFYGHPGRARPEDAPTVIDRVGEMECPVLALMGGADQMIDKQGIDGFEEVLTGANVEHVILTYHGATHSFFDRLYEEQSAAAGDAWASIQHFIATNS